MSRAYRSIGEVLSLLAEEHPDLTISKIRFLESQGLIDPQRTPSGYRKFFEADIERLNWVLIQQRDHFLPLKEIKRRLASGAAARAAPRAAAGAEAVAATPSLFTTRSRGDAGDEADAAAAAGETAPDGSVSLTAAGLARAVGIDAEHIAELQRLGIIVPVAEQSDGDGEAEADDDADPVFDHDALLTARTAAALADHGIPARNLRMFKVAADREAGIYEQLLGPLVARGETDRLRTELTEIVELTEQLRRLLLQRTLRTHLG